MSLFHSASPPSVPIGQYYCYIALHAGLSEEQSVAILILVERLCYYANQRGFPLVVNSLTIHRLVLAATLIFAKYYNDVFYGNHYIS